MIGLLFGRLKVIGEVSRHRYRCICSCGKEIILVESVLLNGHRKSCGCLYDDCRKNGFSRRHGMTGTKTYGIWRGMISRCHSKKNNNYHNYGGRGISVCARWLTFENFLADMGEAPCGKSIDRIDNSGNYEPGNCRWSDRKVQNNNTRRNHVLTYNGESLTVAQWSDRLGISHDTLMARIRYGWTVDKILNTSVRDYRKVM